MKPRKIVLGVVFIIATGVLSTLLAMKSEGIALQYGLWNGTLGLYVAHRVVPPSAGGLELMSKQMLIQVAVDAPLWFLFICATTFALMRLRKKKQSIPIEEKFR